ncbi:MULTISPECIES: AAA family ATPase [unclassified Coleofasciculus]|uniref:AAA family ATPase n=1 Tax=unclassified Coleofasciculus TaxID=2692782 RepID=UPI0018805F18|nr:MULTISPECIES: AAA family ATPase [unclassified Coleofasciculus]MBE9128125.1 AAA family ATPase [Coleofasciculus sp. LEGE 07081]MBE9151197.1 AAA family ATPase [Coleofasciculus sp. LEGE 07092]
MVREDHSRHIVPRIEYLRVKNYRALQDLELKNITPLTVFLGSNGSGKSTIFDVFAFLSECFSVGLRKAWDKRNRFKELRSRGSDGPIVIELKYREQPSAPIITYHLAIDETPKGPYVAEEWLQWRRGQRGQPFRFLNFKEGAGQVVSGEMPDEEDERISEQLDSPEMLAVNTLGQFAKHPRVSALRRFIAGWYLSYLSADNTRSVPEAGPQERLSAIGDNLPNVIQYLKEQHPDRLGQILNTLSQRIPRLEKVETEMMPDGRLLLQVKDAPFAHPILAKFASDGTLKMLAYLTVLYDPDPPQLVGIEEPENHLHPRLLPELAEECRSASARTQLMVTTHSPFFVNGLKPEELWVLYRDEQGYTQAQRTADMRGIPQFMEHGAQLGDLWMESFFEVGDPLLNSGGRKVMANPRKSPKEA